ncbi:MAG: rhamnulose-1-phosphate aldolase [Candidatus Marinimicrobia bacterium]|nr:rhamnulose-1-phosphate aldolase [Candidatus Neomarinimicrobiota bacterium]
MNLFTKQNEIEKILRDVQRVAEILFQKGWSEKNAGNISVKLPDAIALVSNPKVHPLDKPFPALADTCFYMTGTGKRMQDVAVSATDNGLFIQITPDGHGYIPVKATDQEVRPTSEFPSHLGIHNMIAERGSHETIVMHTHATEIIALTQNPKIKSSEALNKILWGMHPETMVFIPKGAGFVPYILPGTQTIADATIEQFASHDIVVWEKHGIFAIGKDVIDTFDNIDIACKSAKIWFACKSAGFEPEGMTDEQLDELRDLVKKFNS